MQTRNIERALLALMASGAVVACKTVTQQDINRSQTYYDLGVNELTNGKFESALDDFQRALGFNPNYAEAHMGLGLVWWHKAQFDDAQDEYDKARAELERAVELRPAFSEAWNNLGALCIERSDYARAVVAFKSALADPLYKTPYLARSNLGWVYHLQGNEREALAQIREALVAEPAYCVGHKQLASVYDDTHRPDDAAAEWEAFVKYCPDDPDAQLHSGRLHEARGDLERAARAYLRCQLRAQKINRSHVLIHVCGQALDRMPPLPPAEVQKIQDQINPPDRPTEVVQPSSESTGSQ